MSEVTNSILFRQKLYQNFKQSGLLSQLKTTLRTNLLQKLQKPQHVPSMDPNKDQLQRKKPLYLRDKFLSCIVRQYLLKSKKQYTLSILLPQSNLEDDDCLNYNEMSQIINLDVPDLIDGRQSSFIEVLVNQWVKFRAAEVCQRSTQTDYSEPVSKKLEDIEKQYRPKMEYWKLMPGPKQESSQNMSVLAKQQRMRQQFELQKKRIRRELQLSVKAQIQKKYESQYDFRTKQMQKQHQGRLTQVKNRQKTIIDSLQRKTKELQQKSRQINENEMKMIKKYEDKMNELDMEHRRKIKDLEQKQKQFWKKQLQLKAKKRQYQDSIRLVKQKIIDETLQQGKEH